MWTQEKLQKGEFLLKAIATDRNIADLMTKYLGGARIEELLARFGVQRCTRGLVVASLVGTAEAQGRYEFTDCVMLGVVYTVLILAVALTVVAWCSCGRLCRR